MFLEGFTIATQAIQGWEKTTWSAITCFSKFDQKILFFNEGNAFTHP